MKRVSGVLGVALCALCLVPCVASAQINMPDPSLIHGRALPAPELPSGTVTVRVVREAIGNNIAGQDVRMTAGGTTRTAKTDEQGRAEFAGLPQGAQARAEATVDGEALISEPFAVPGSGGLRVILVAGLKEAAARREREAAAGAAAPPVRGVVVLGENSRILMDFQDDALQVFYTLDIVNNARTPVDIGGPLIIDLPSSAGGATMLQGSSPSATVSGERVTVTGPFAPGSTSVQVGFRLNPDRPNLTVEQKWPAAMQQVTVAIEKIGAVNMTSPQFSTVGEVNSENGTPFLLGNGPALPAGGTVILELSNLPVHSNMPQMITLGLTSIILAVGAWLAFSVRTKGDDLRRRLIDRRDALLSEVAALEERRRRGGPSGPPGQDAKAAARRQRLLTELEHIYGELDEPGAGPQGGGEGVAA